MAVLNFLSGKIYLKYIMDGLDFYSRSHWLDRLVKVQTTGVLFCIIPFVLWERGVGAKTLMRIYGVVYLVFSCLFLLLFGLQLDI